MDKNEALIRELNDSFRTTFIGGRVFVTASVGNLPQEVQSRALSAIRAFQSFNEHNDPHGEHDFGAFSLAGYRFLWKIDCYDRSEDRGSEDPSDPDQTTRVLTIMLAEEY